MIRFLFWKCSCSTNALQMSVEIGDIDRSLVEFAGIRVRSKSWKNDDRVSVATKQLEKVERIFSRSEHLAQRRTSRKRSSRDRPGHDISLGVLQRKEFICRQLLECAAAYSAIQSHIGSFSWAIPAQNVRGFERTNYSTNCKYDNYVLVEENMVVIKNFPGVIFVQNNSHHNQFSERTGFE